MYGKCCFPMAHIQYFGLEGGLSSSPEGIVVFFSKYFPKGTMVEMIIPLCECKWALLTLLWKFYSFEPCYWSQEGLVTFTQELQLHPSGLPFMRELQAREGDKCTVQLCYLLFWQRASKFCDCWEICDWNKVTTR